MAQAGFVETLEEVGNNVVATGSGAIDLSGLTFAFTGVGNAFINPGAGTISSGALRTSTAGFIEIDSYNGVVGPTSFGSGLPPYATSSNSDSGDAVGISGSFGYLVVPNGYSSGNPLSNTSTYLNKTFSSIGVTPGTYAWTWGTGADQNYKLVIGTATGDPHFTTYKGIHYDYQGIGDFLLTRSTVDKSEVRVHTRPTYGGSAVTIMSEAAARLGGHTVTFDIDRASKGGSFVWLDGSPLSLSIGSPLFTSDGSEISQISANDYQIVWSTGEILDIMNEDTYLDLSFQLSWLDLLGPMEGLLSSELDPDRWRVTGAASLFSPVPEPSTLTLLGVGLGLMGIAMLRRRAISSMPV